MRSSWRTHTETCRQAAVAAAVALTMAACADADPAPFGAELESMAGTAASGELVVVDLGTLGGDATSAFDINNRGTVVGTSRTSGGAQMPFVWTSEAGMRALDVAGGAAGAALAINDAGVIVGWIADAFGAPQAVRWLADGTIELLEQMDGTGPGMATGVSNGGLVVGWNFSVHAGGWPAGTVWSESGAERACLTGTWEDMPTGINDAGVIVGNGLIQPDAFGTPGLMFIPSYVGYATTRGTGDCRPILSDRQLVTRASAVNSAGAVAVRAADYTLETVDGISRFTFTGWSGGRYSAGLGFETADGAAGGQSINNRGEVASEAGINDAGDRVDGRYLWTRRGRFFAGAPLSRPSAATRQRAFNGGADTSGCPAPIAALVRSGAMTECPARTLERGARAATR